MKELPLILLECMVTASWIFWQWHIILQVAIVWLEALELVKKHMCQVLLSSNVRLQESQIMALK